MEKQNKKKSTPKPRTTSSNKLPEKKSKFLDGKKRFWTWIPKPFRDSISPWVATAIVTFCILWNKLGWIGAWGYIMNIFGALSLTVIIVMILIFFSVNQYNLAIYIKELKEQKKKIRILWSIIYFLIAVAFLYFTFDGIMHTVNIELPSVQTSTPTPTITSSPTFTNTPTFTPSNTSSPTLISISTNTPFPDSMSELNWCEPLEIDFPCKYRIKSGDWDTKVSMLIYGNAGLADRINDLYRNEKGNFSAYVPDDVIVIPEKNRTQNEDYYRDYFQIISHPIRDCEGEIFGFPCWYISEGESYNALTEKYPMQIDPTCIENANIILFNGAKVNITPKVGIILVLPVCP